TKAACGSSSWEGKAGSADSQTIASRMWYWKRSYENGRPNVHDPTDKSAIADSALEADTAVPGADACTDRAGAAHTGTSADENSALQELIRNAQGMPNFGGVAGDLAANF